MLSTANIAIDFFTMCVLFLFPSSKVLSVFMCVFYFISFAIAMRYKAPDLIKMNKKAGETEKKAKQATERLKV